MRKKGELHEIEYKDLRAAMHVRGREETVGYINTEMNGADSVFSPYELLEKALKEVGVEGLYLEFGVFSGNSINYIADNTNEFVFGFDSFEGLPERWRDGFTKGHFKVDQLPKVRENICLIKGWFDEALSDFVANNERNVAFMHVDCDLYSSSKTIFEYLGDLIVDGTEIVFDEYLNYYVWKEGEFKAFQEFVEMKKHKYKYIGYNCKHEQVAVKIISV